MSEMDKLRGRVSAMETELTRLPAVEAEVSRLREENAVTRTVASMADRDVSEFRGALQGHVRTLNALRETQLEQGQTLTAHGHAIEGIAAAVGGLVVQVSTLADKVDGLGGQFNALADNVGGQVGALDGKVDNMGAQIGELITMVRRIAPPDPTD